MEHYIVNKKIDLQEKTLNLFTIKGISLQVVLEIIEEKIRSANDDKELSNIFRFIRSLNLKFKNEAFGIFYLCVIICIFLVGIILFGSFMGGVSFTALGYLFCTFTMAAIINGIFIFRRIKYTKKISDSIALKKVMLDNNLSFDVSNKQKLLKIFKRDFFIFRQGNHSSELTSYIKGKYKNIFQYHYFNLHYIDEHISTSTDANGNQSSNTTYYHYDLYGIIMPLNIKHFIKISNYEMAFKFRKFIKWKTSSITFNKQFKIYTDQEQAIAIFLQPKIIQQIEKLAEIFPKLDIEISACGSLVLSTFDQELLNYDREYGVDQLDLFENEIKQTLNQTKLNKALEFINFLRNDHQHI